MNDIKSDMQDKIESIDARMKLLMDAKGMEPLKEGWIKEIRTACNIPLSYIASKYKGGVTEQAIRELEYSECGKGNPNQERTITLDSLQRIGDILDLELVYGFVPKKATDKRFLLWSRVYNKIRTYISYVYRQEIDELVKLGIRSNAKSPDYFQSQISKQTKLYLKKMPKSFWKKYDEMLIEKEKKGSN